MISISRQPMDNRRLEELIREVSSDFEGEPGFWQLAVEGRQLLVVTDESNNRMRVMTIVADEEELTDDLRSILLDANFDRALDAKYATSQDYLWSVFTHPLAELTDDQFFDAVQQVWTLADNFGTSFSSSDLVFGSDS